MIKKWFLRGAILKGALSVLSVLFTPTVAFGQPVQLRPFPERIDAAGAVALCQQLVEQQIQALKYHRAPFLVKGVPVTETEYRSHANIVCVTEQLDPPSSFSMHT